MILDTNALSAFIDGNSALGEVLRRQSRVALPVIVIGEFRYGILGSRHRRAYEDWLDAHLPNFDVLSLSLDTASHYARLRLALRRLARPIPANDAWIAALALEHRLSVLSRDARFDVVPGLVRTSW